MTGQQVCRSVEIAPELLKDADAEMLQDLILSAVNMALDQSRELASTRMGPLAGGMPGMGGADLVYCGEGKDEVRVSDLAFRLAR